MKSVSLIIVNYHSESHVIATLSQLSSKHEELPDQLILIDNSPANGLVQQLTHLHLKIDYHATDENIGFAGGVNIGLKFCTGRFVILLNPDAYPQQGCLGGLVKVLADDKDIAVAGPVLLSMDKGSKPMISATKCDPTLVISLIEYTILRRFVARDWLNKNYFITPGEEKVVDCAMVQGACFAFRKSWLRRVGPFDAESFFLYWEETDFCRRIRNLGGKVVYCTHLACEHLGGASIDGGSQNIHFFWKSLYSYHKKHNGPLAAIILRLMLIPSMTAELLMLQILNLFRHREDRQLDKDISRMRLLLIEQFRKV